MKRFFASLVIGGTLALGATGCSDWVQDIEDPIDVIADNLLTAEQQIQFQMNGVERTFAVAYGLTSVLAEGQSDAFVFGGSNATFPTFQQADQCDYLLDNNSNTNALLQVGRFRLFADTLLARVAAVGTFTNAGLKSRAEYVGHLYAGLAREHYANFYGLAPTQGGGFNIPNGPFVGSQELYNIAIQRYGQAAAALPGTREARIANTLIARNRLFRGEYAQALTAAQSGLVKADAAFLARFSSESQNNWFSEAGLGRSQFIPSARMRAYVTANPAEAARVKLRAISATVQIQDVYPALDSPITITDWAENYLMIAEAMVRTSTASVNFDGGAKTALDLVNEVRAAFNIAPLAAVDLNEIFVEREKTLFARGLRLVDNRRQGAMGAECTGAWRFIAITERERNANPNL